MKESSCFHCGDTSVSMVLFDEKQFCCNGCKTVYEILNEHELSKYYDMEQTPGKSPEVNSSKYDYLSTNKIAEKLLTFSDDTTQVVTLQIPHIHCSSCIWVLENLNKLHSAIIVSRVNFPKKTVQITYKHKSISLQDVVLLLVSIGYEPYISLANEGSQKTKKDNTLLYKLAIAGFSFGNVMFLSFPEYFEMNEFWLNQFKPFFHYIMLFFTIPVVFYAAQDYFKAAYKGIRHGIINIDIPIALGVLVLFVRSVFDVVTQTGQGFFDSLCGLVFFLLLGKFFQKKTYSFLSFERDYKSYFPIAVTVLNNNKEESIPVHDIKKGDRLLIRNQELIPVDCTLIKGHAIIDYSFVTGESKPVAKQEGAQLFAGGKQEKGAIEVVALKTISQSYLTQLWSNDVFNINKQDQLETLTNAISKYFTIVILAITAITFTYWFIVDKAIVINAVTAVLIIACPCALALSAPFTLGNVLRILGRKKMYLKNATVIESLSKITTVVFDKTGTLTNSKKSSIQYTGIALSLAQKTATKSVLRGSNHPLSRMLYVHFKDIETTDVSNFKEHVGKGVEASVLDVKIKIGAAKFVGAKPLKTNKSVIHIAFNGVETGVFVVGNSYRTGMEKVFKTLAKNVNLVVLSGDNDGEKEYLSASLPNKTALVFHQKPDEKLTYIKKLQDKGEQVLMVGDGLNDSGALAQSNVGVVISENVNVFSPACDAIVDASTFSEIPKLLRFSKLAKYVIIMSFIISFLYNIIGLSFAVSGNLSPIIAAILMPLSSISVVAFVTFITNVMGRKLFR